MLYVVEYFGTIGSDNIMLPVARNAINIILRNASECMKQFAFAFSNLASILLPQC